MTIALGSRCLEIPPEVAHRLGSYVYLYIDPRDHRPFYVGKGKVERALMSPWHVPLTLTLSPFEGERGHEEAIPADECKPLFIRRIGCEVIAVALDGEAGVLQDLRELQSEVAVGEVDDAHAFGFHRTSPSTLPSSR